MAQDNARRKLARGSNAGLVKIAEVSGTGASGVLEFASIPPSFRNLIVSFIGRSSAAVTASNVQLTFETSPTAGAYDHQRVNAAAAVVSASENIGASDFIIAGIVAGASSTASVHGGGRIYLPEYANTGVFKVIGSHSFGAGSLGTGVIFAEIGTGVWESLTAINRIRLTLASGSWATTSRATLYGEP